MYGTLLNPFLTAEPALLSADLTLSEREGPEDAESDDLDCNLLRAIAPASLSGFFWGACTATLGNAECFDGASVNNSMPSMTSSASLSETSSNSSNASIHIASRSSKLISSM